MGLKENHKRSLIGMVSGLKNVPKEEIEKLYWQQKLTLSQIGRMFSVTYPTVIYWMKKRGVHTRGVRKYETRPFDGNELEKAYVMGLRLGDLNVRAHRRQILARTSTSHPAMLELFRNIFQRYSHVHQFSMFNPKKKPHFDWQIYALLDKSFDFLLSKAAPDDTLTNEDKFYAFLAGYTDAEGCILITPNGNGLRFYFQVAAEDKRTLFVIANKLREAGYHFTLRISAKKGENYGRKYNKNYWELRIATKADVIKLLERLALRHQEKIKWKKLVLKMREVKMWSDVKEEVAALRKNIQAEVNKCVIESEETFNRRLMEKTTTLRQTDCSEQKI